LKSTLRGEHLTVQEETVGQDDRQPIAARVFIVNPLPVDLV
jgi:hypothetical protein